MLHIAVCEDNLSEVAHTRKLLEGYFAGKPSGSYKADFFKTAEELLAAVAHGNTFDLYLLDILMPGMNGIALSRRLRAQGLTGSIVFLTATRDFALEAFGVRAVDYLLKPLDEPAFQAALDNAIALLSSRDDAYTLVQMPEGDRMVNLTDIVAVEVQGHTLCYYLHSGELLKSKVLRVAFAAAADDLIRDGRFIRPHQSYLVNAAHVSCFSKQRITMDNGMAIPVSRLRFGEVKAEYMDYLNRRNSATGKASDGTY